MKSGFDITLLLAAINALLSATALILVILVAVKAGKSAGRLEDLERRFNTLDEELKGHGERIANLEKPARRGADEARPAHRESGSPMRDADPAQNGASDDSNSAPGVLPPYHPRMLSSQQKQPDGADTSARVIEEDEPPRDEPGEFADLLAILGERSQQSRDQWEDSLKGYTWKYVFLSVSDGDPYILDEGGKQSRFVAVEIPGHGGQVAIFPSYSCSNVSADDVKKLFQIRVESGDGRLYKVIRPAIGAEVSDIQFTVKSSGKGSLECR